MQHSHLFLPSDFFLNDTNPSTTVESGGPEPKHTIIYKRRLISQRVHQGLMILYPVPWHVVVRIVCCSTCPSLPSPESVYGPIIYRRYQLDPVRYSLVRFVETVQYSLEIMLLNGSQSLPDKPIGSAITSDQLVTLSSFSCLLTHSNDSLMPALLVFAVRYG
ncbi:hypothetical protein H9L39_04518 [Fusarium oxysporum f. sp. albedinis]|nr:hypothetical protein H9L39_04518 [Fusarium oxysporum f. sp. albedinis]